MLAARHDDDDDERKIVREIKKVCFDLKIASQENFFNLFEGLSDCCH